MKNLQPMNNNKKSEITDERILIGTLGEVYFIDNNCSIDLQHEINLYRKFRASYVEPENRIIRSLFWLTRSIFPSLQDWTRSWKTKWRIRMVLDGANIIFDTFDTREEAIKYEINLLKEGVL